MDSIQKAIRSRDKYLSENPHLRNFQGEIDSILDKCCSSGDRIEALGLMIHEKLTQLRDVVIKLQELLR